MTIAPNRFGARALKAAAVTPAQTLSE